MKQVLFILGLSLMMVSCSNDGGEGGTGDDTFEAVIDGSDYSISGQYAWADLIAGDLFVVYGSQDQTMSGFSNLFISFPGGTPSVGEYDLSNSDQAIATYLDTGSGATWLSSLNGGSGSVEVTDISSDRIIGNFSCTGVSTDGSSNINVTSGKFDVRIGF